MADAEGKQRVIQVQGNFELHSPALETRLQELDKKIQDLKTVKPKKKDFWEIIQALALPSLFSSVLLAWVGWLFTGSVNQVLSERQAELNAVKEMESLIVAMEDKNLDRPTALRKAAVLASFGRYSVPAFINLLEIGNQYNPYTAMGAEQGLRMVASTQPAVVCAQVSEIIRNRSGLYPWQTHQSALQILSDVNCQSSLEAVSRYQRDITSLPAFKKIVSDQPEESEFQAIKELAKNTYERLQQMPKPGFWERLRRFVTPRFDQTD